MLMKVKSFQIPFLSPAQRMKIGTPITNNSPAAIFYDPDSADDIDDDDPDEDLDI